MPVFPSLIFFALFLSLSPFPLLRRSSRFSASSDLYPQSIWKPLSANQLRFVFNNPQHQVVSHRSASVSPTKAFSWIHLVALMRPAQASTRPARRQVIIVGSTVRRLLSKRYHWLRPEMDHGSETATITRASEAAGDNEVASNKTRIVKWSTESGGNNHQLHG